MRGFTLLELIIVIILVVVLIGVALPRFANQIDQTQIGVNTALAARLQTSINAAHAQWRLLGTPGRIQNLPGFDDEVLDISTVGWPIGTNKGNANDNVGRGNNGCTALWTYLLVGAPDVALNNSANYQAFRHTGNRVCSYVQRDRGDTAARNQAQIGVRYDSRSGISRVCGQWVRQPC